MRAPQPPPANSPDLRRTGELRTRFRDWAAETYAHGGFPEREMDALRTSGLFAVTLPGEALDQQAGRTPGLLRLLTDIGTGNLSAGRIYEGHVNALQLIGRFGTEGQRRHWYAEARAGHLFGVWNTEMADGVHLHPDGVGTVRVAGSKSFCSGSSYVTRPVITGRLSADPGGWQMAVVPLNDHLPEVDESFWTPLGMRNSVSHKVDFTGIRLDRHDLLGAPEDYNRQPWLSGGAIRFAAVQLGGAAALLEATLDYLRDAGRTTDPYQRSRVGQMTILVESGRQWLDRAGEIADSDPDPTRVIHYANMARTAIAGCCEECIQLAQRSVGARGLLHPQPIARLCADLSMYLRQPAPDAALEAVGKFLLDGSPTG